MLELCFLWGERWLAGRIRAWRWAAVAAGVGLLAGCATSMPPAGPTDLSDPGWTIRHGQAVWKSGPDAAGVAGELMVAMHQDGRSLVQFVKTPLPFVTAELGSNTWRINFMADRRSYSGRGAPPDRILWLQFPDGLIGRHTSTNWYFARTKDDGWHFEHLGTEESLDGFLTTTRLPRLHVIRENETINRIGRIYGVTTTALRAANPGAGQDWIHPGNIIQLPPPPTNSPAALTAPPPSAPSAPAPRP